MKLALISDTHMQHDRLQMPEADILIHAGDWTWKGEENHTIEFLTWLNAQNYKHKLYVAGNHDYYPENEPTKFKALCKQYAPTCMYLENSNVVIDGVKFHGSPISPFFGGMAFNAHRGKEIQSYWDEIPDDTNVLITHGPVLGFGDKLSRWGSEPGKNIGCADLLNAINTRLRALRLHVSGHIHE